ncbi:MAG: magnesium chelatase, partial [Bacillota bacterium]|nr:magnesium chelatase [Bacillota bacterium]
MLDRIDLQIEVNRLTYGELHAEGEEEPSAKIRSRVIKARKIQQQRYKDLGFITNAQLNRKYF